MKFGERFVAEGDNEKGLLRKFPDQPVGHDWDFVTKDLPGGSHSQGFHLDEVGRRWISQDL
jgi:hypothetical protein